jgi:DNA-binding transcriptional LysR family regulator
LEGCVDRLEAMAMLVEAVDNGSLSAVSRKMNVPLPTVSRKIADLESHLGTRLLIRSTRKLVLTEGWCCVCQCREKNPGTGR